MALKSFAGGLLFGEALGPEPFRILVLHGWGRRGSDFKLSLEGLPALAVDLPGFGASPPPLTPMGSGGYAKLVEPVLADFETPCIIVAHSFGGRVAVMLAASHPDMVSGLVLTGVPLLAWRRPRKPSTWFRLVRMAAELKLISQARMEATRRRYGSADYAAASGVMRGVLVRVVSESYEKELSALRCPVHLLWGAEDREVPLVVAERAVDAIGGDRATLEVLEGVGHHVPVQAPARLRTAVEDMLG
jgi:pimeloyl-ACP methyl ester carboxylesterase